MRPRQAPSGIDPAVVVAVLSEAIPYIRRFAGKIVVLKYGGSALVPAGGGNGASPEAAVSGPAVSGPAASGTAVSGTAVSGPAVSGPAVSGPAVDESLRNFAADVALLRSVGVLPVVVHGGGPQISELMARLGKTPEFREGLRVTDAESLDIVRMVLVGRVNRDIVDAVNVHGPLAVGLSGEDAGLIEAGAQHPELGFVGEVRRVDPTILTRLLNEGLVPVVATIGADDQGQAYNINADTVAGAIAGALHAEKLVFLTDVTGIRAVASDPDSVVTRLAGTDLERLIADGVVEGGMIPKARAACEALGAGVGSVHVLDGRVPHVVLIELFTEEGLGTMITPDVPGVPGALDVPSAPGAPSDLENATGGRR